MKRNYLFFSQSVCLMGVYGQCSGEGATLHEAIGNFNSQIGCLFESIGHILNGGLNE